MTKRKFSSLALIVIGGLGSVAIARGPVIPAGNNELRTIGGSVFFGGFDLPPIPADFFFPGSSPFFGEVRLQGEPLSPSDGNFDTVVERLQPANLPSPGASDTIDIEIVALSLGSVAPIEIDGTCWAMRWNLAGQAIAPGSVTITRMHDTGGFISMVLPIAPRFTFTDVSGVLPQKTFSPAEVIVESFSDIKYTELVPPNPTPSSGGMFLEPCHFGELESPDGFSMRLFVEQAYGGTTSSVACFAPDSGSGAADLPASCPYTTCDNTMTLTDGFPSGTGLNLAIDLGNAVGISTSPGGSLGGTITSYTSDWCMDFTGFGALAGFSRSTCATIIVQVHNSPHKVGNVLVNVQQDMFSISGSIFGDPDFDTLTIQGGTNFGLPSPGHTTLSVLSDGNWNVDSFFDLEYRITFTGAPGSILEGFGGTDTNRTRFEQGCPLPAPSCDAPDNGAGSVDLPAVCDYESSDEVIDIFVNGLPPATRLRAATTLGDIVVTSRVPGGSLGGEVQTFNANLFLAIDGEGALAGFSRFVTIPVVCEAHTAPRIDFSGMQEIRYELFSKSGSIPPGDPDFATLSITAGSNFGLPSPGHTTLTQLPTGDWNVDSFFDLEYTITFTGAPGGALDSLTGGDTDVVRLVQGWEEEPLPPDFFFGLPHHPINYACLAPNASGNLVVSNIGSSGEDGVSIDLGHAQGFQSVVDFGPVGALPTGGLFEIKSRVIGAGGSAAVVFRGQADGKAQIEVRAGSRYSMVDIRVKLDNNIVSSQTFVAPFPNPLVVANIGSSGEDGVTVRAVVPDSDGIFWVDSFFDLEYAIPGDTQISGDPGFVVADSVRFVLTPVGGVAEPPLTGVDITGGASLAQGQITEVNPSGKIGTALIQDNHVVATEGAAHLIGGGSILGGPSGGLQVSNIGSSGLDGVRMEPLPPPRNVGKAIEITGVNSQDDGQISTFIWRQVGTLGGITDRPFQETDLPINGADREINMSSEPWLFPNATVTVLSGGVVQLIVPNVPLGGLMAFRVDNNDLPVIFASEVITVGNPPVATGMTHTFVWDFVSDIGVNAPPSMAGDKNQALPPLTGDEIRIETTANLPLAARGGGSPSDNLQGIVVLCSTGGGSGGTIWLDISDVSTTFIDLCPADTNDSGTVNVTDLLDLLAAWGTCPAPCPPDINLDGTVNVTDLLALLAAWGVCP